MTKSVKDMLGRSGIIPLSEALRVLGERLEMCSERAPEEISLEQGLGRVLAQAVFSPEDIPAHPRSVMDGYVVKATDTFGATEGIPAYLNVSGEVTMGEFPKTGPAGECCFKIATGGLLPPETDAVVMLEHTVQTGTEMIEVVKPVAPGENIISRGDDVKKGHDLFTKGHSLRPQDLGLLAGLGITTLTVYPRVTVGIFSTGDEIVPFSQSPPPGKVRDMNSVNLAALSRNHGARATFYGVVHDDEEQFLGTARKAFAENDIVIFSGSSSVGSRDLGELVVCKLADLLIHGVAIKPGKPVIVAFSGDKALFGLPGHPVSAAVAFDLFVCPVIESFAGQKKNSFPRRRAVEAICKRNMNSAGGRTDFVRVVLKRNADGEYEAYPVLGKSSALSTMVAADGFFRIEESSQGVEAGENIVVYLYD
nr:molybdopterin molybdotransferase MoeA [Desulfobulbaceae bacterium]